MSDYFEEEEFTTQFSGGTLKRILGLIRPHWKYAAGFTVAILLTSVVDAYFTFLGKRIIDEGIMEGNQDVLIQILILYFSLILVQAVMVFGFIFLVGLLGERVRYDLRQKMFNHLQDLSLSYYSKTPVGWIMSRVTSDSDRVSDLVTWGVVDVSWAATNIITSAIFMFIINWKLALIVLAVLPILAWIAIQFRKHILAEFRKVRKTNSKITGEFNQNITGVRVVKALGREDANMGEFSNLTSEMYRSAYRAAWLSALFLPTVQVVAAVALGAVILAGGGEIRTNALTIGGIQAFVSYVTFMLWPIQDLARVYAEMQNSIASAERMFSLIDATPDISDRSGAFDPGTISGDIVFNDVTFYYDDSDKKETGEKKSVLTHFDLHVKRGETIALVGPTGGGKSTIVNLLCRFYEPKEGAITIGGNDYTQYSLFSIQSRIGVVLQTPHLFSGSIRENIRYGRLNATDEEVQQAASLAGAHDFITGFEKGYDTNVGEGGSLLSTGQKQLISLARAVLAKPEIFIMDEATSSVDTLTEALIQRGMEVLMEGRTSFVIAHRLSTIRRADKILFIQDGQVAEMGSHSELLKKRGLYYHLYTRQFRHQMAVEYGMMDGSEINVSGEQPAPSA